MEQSTNSSAQYIARLAGLTVAVGVGAAVATGPGIALATASEQTTASQTPSGRETNEPADGTENKESTGTDPADLPSSRLDAEDEEGDDGDIEADDDLDTDEDVDVDDEDSDVDEDVDDDTDIDVVDEEPSAEEPDAVDEEPRDSDPAGDGAPEVPAGQSPANGSRTEIDDQDEEIDLSADDELADNDALDNDAPDVGQTELETGIDDTSVDGGSTQQASLRVASVNTTIPDDTETVELAMSEAAKVTTAAVAVNNTLLKTLSTMVEAMLAWARRQITAFFNLFTPKRTATSTSETLSVSALAAADDTSDRTAELQAMFDALKSGQTLTLKAGEIYRHSGNLYIRNDGVKINGNGATLLATNSDTSSLWVVANNVSVSNLNVTGATGLARNDSTYRAGMVVGRKTGVKLTDITITGGASAGLFVMGAYNFTFDRVTVRDTAADGIQITEGAYKGIINNAKIERTGDDAIAVVSYQGGLASHDIVINSPVVDTTKQRGLVVTGGYNITFNKINVKRTALSAVFVGNQRTDVYSTSSVSNVVVKGGTITGAHTYKGDPMSVILLTSENPNATITKVTISDITVVDPSPSAYSVIGHARMGGGKISSVVYKNISLTGKTLLYAVGTNAPGTYTATGFKAWGIPIMASLFTTTKRGTCATWAC